MEIRLLAHTITEVKENEEKLADFRKLTKKQLKIVKHSVGIPNGNQPFDMYKALLFCTRMANICYLKGDFSETINEPIEKSFSRLKYVLSSGHHSVFDHFKLTFEFSGIPKVIAMFLNNEKDYGTSEKSARFTEFENLDGIQGELYSKWCNLLVPVIEAKYPNLYDESKEDPRIKIRKLAQENARYFVSIFSPTTTMGYTTSLRQFCCLLFMFKDYIENHEDNDFNRRLIPYMKAFVSKSKPFEVEALVPPAVKHRRLSLIGDQDYFDIPDLFSYVYQTTYYATITCFAQGQRHRNEDMFLYLLNTYKFIIPEILNHNVKLTLEWMKDSKLVAGMFPQGQIVKIVQTGTIDTFLMKYSERCCGCAQLETMRHQVEIANKMVAQSPYAYKVLNITNGQTARCLFTDGSCSTPCMLGSKQFERLI